MVSVMFSCLAGYGVTRFRFKGKESFLGFILMTQMFPSIMLLIPYYKVLDMYGLKDSLVGMMCVYISFTIPFCSWMMVGFFRTIPLELDEAAIIDGCSRWKAFYKITLPMTCLLYTSRYIPLNYIKARLNVAAMHVQARLIYFI